MEDNHPGENWGGKTSGLLQIQRSMEMAERQKHEAKVMEMISLASKGNLPSLKVRPADDHCLALPWTRPNLLTCVARGINTPGNY